MARAIPDRETLTVEFKSDRVLDGSSLPDNDIILAIVCLTNAEGGDLYRGVEDDGTVTGVTPRHDDALGAAALIANRTSPAVTVRVDRLLEEGKPYLRIQVPKSESIVSTSDGLVQRRRMLADNKPACLPLYPHEYIQRQSDLRRLDHSALPVSHSTVDDLDPVERDRLRRLVTRYGGDSTLIALSDEEMDGALGL